jgi:hypothetical protein
MAEAQLSWNLHLPTCRMKVIQLLFLFCSLIQALGAATPTLTSSVTELTQPSALTTVTWSGVQNPSTSDWVAVFCTGGTYYWWVYATGKADDSIDMMLFANSPGSGCESLQLGYWQGKDVAFTSAPITYVPMIQQVHISLTSNLSNMVVDFVSSGAGSDAACFFGTSPTGLVRKAAAVTTNYATIGNVSHALLTGLVPGDRVYYQCTDGVVSSQVYNFSAGAVPVAGSGAPQRIAVWADFGVNDGFGLQQIAEDAAAGAFDFSLHAGDYSYNFESGNSANGASSIKRRAPLASTHV